MSPEAPKSHLPFEFTENEKLFEQIMHPRFMRLLSNPNVVINSIEESGNAFGEFLFVTLTQQNLQESKPLTFYGLGYHEQRERWITEYWRWFESYRDTKGKVMSKKQALEQIKARQEWVSGLAASEPKPSRRAQLYELMAELTDEDGALTDLEDFGWAFLGEDEN